MSQGCRLSVCLEVVGQESLFQSLSLVPHVVDCLRVDGGAVHSVLAREAMADARGVVADALVGAVHLAEIAWLSLVLCAAWRVLGRHASAVRLHDLRAWVVCRRAVTYNE